METTSAASDHPALTGAVLGVAGTSVPPATDDGSFSWPRLFPEIAAQPSPKDEEYES
jgi:hypothetical protein